MKIRNAALLFSIISRHNASAFHAASRPSARAIRSFPTSSPLPLNALPTASQVGADDFMKQLGHASQIIPLLHPPSTASSESFPKVDDATLLEILSKQLSHSDGVRGFFAVYLTSPESLTVEDDGVPSVLAEAVRGADKEVMVPLACMNVIMPTAMISIHQDPELKECSSKTANNGKKILRIIRDSEEVKRNCKAILRVCQGEADGVDEELLEYWSKFFKNYKYEEKQKEDIAAVMAEFCSN